MALALLLTIAGALIAAEVGALLALFGLSWVALLLGTALVALGAVALRKQMLPLAVVSAALALPAAAVTLTQRPLDRSVGLLTVLPTDVNEINGKTFRRGAGSIFLDLRHAKWPSSGTITVRASSDLGRVVVALPRDRCIATSVTARLADGPPETTRTVLAVAGRSRWADADRVDGWAFPYENWELPRTEIDSYAFPVALLAYGKRDDDGEHVRQPPSAGPTLRLDLRGTATSVVRDLPQQVGPMTPLSDLGPQVGNAFWPAGIQLPLQPGELVAADGWRHTWTDDQITRKVPQAWARWERATIRAQANQARRAAGACARPTELATYWSTRQFAEFGSLTMLDESGVPLEASQVEKVLQNGQTLYDELFNPLTPTEVRERLRRAGLPSSYLVSVNGQGTVRRQQMQADGTLTTTKMTAGNPGGVK